MASPVLSLLHRPALTRPADEFVLATVMLFLAVTIVRWVRDPGSPLHIADLDAALAVIGVLSGAILTGLILTPLGRRSGGHMNPAVTVSLWLMGAFPGPSVVPYVLAQLAGSATGTVLARAAWGHTVSVSSVDYAAIAPAPDWSPPAVFLAEAGSMAAIIVAVGFVARPRSARFLPYLIGSAVALVIALLGPRSGGSINPARQFGPAAMAGQGTDLWIYLVAPILGAVLGACFHHCLARLRSRAQRAQAVASAIPEGFRSVGTLPHTDRKVRHNAG
ncbi:MIP/aquaporin family protein [Streptomyces sp. NPDC049040]|uniref:MIP/aquaporin family protein n=1 Tax=Streptomyces sp. NPDC049040 TaxID=3365593 RepID=UPI0037181709